ncbi:hypothetical protein [Spirosoma foliorum]|uniref:Uncharacterized protein n=1 Tax=Spirosoma foliorum TaxID=2710596 RepID=A0A7G5GUT7_9BACT|nr:hypothetical protein [Spirosoma foliorum]QMW02629.1 hypothetical protein H3H32_32790 [Spirosoma foliorum]
MSAFSEAKQFWAYLVISHEVHALALVNDSPQYGGTDLPNRGIVRENKPACLTKKEIPTHSNASLIFQLFRIAPLSNKLTEQA